MKKIATFVLMLSAPLFSFSSHALTITNDTSHTVNFDLRVDTYQGLGCVDLKECDYVMDAYLIGTGRKFELKPFNFERKDGETVCIQWANIWIASPAFGNKDVPLTDCAINIVYDDKMNPVIKETPTDCTNRKPRPEDFKKIC